MVVEIDSWCKAQQIDCLYFLADCEDPETIRLAQENFFSLVDIRLTLGLNLSGLPEMPPAAGGIRLSQKNDIPLLRSIARSNHTGSRFYFDCNFPRDRCDALYETWIEKSCCGYADAVFVPEVGGEPAGYISCHLKPDQTGNIGLVGLASEARGKDVATGLIHVALRWFLARNVKHVTVVTQGRNVVAQRLYQHCGFSTQFLHLWYHRWFLSRTKVGK
jgi:dTDP-4-amino-4,6-dideoxy-D-galactose acyltransferase